MIAIVPASDYHADSFTDGEPTLSASCAKILLNQSPRHAWFLHPRLNPDWQPPAPEQKFDVGTAAHALLLEGRNAIGVVDAADWRTKDAKELRDAYRDQGRIPLLADQAEEVFAMLGAVTPEIAPFLRIGKPEQTLLWHEPDGTGCRARLDWLTDDYADVVDLKFTSRSANPDGYDRQLFAMGYDIQAAFYRRGVERLTGVRPEFTLIVVETAPPYELAALSLAPSAWELAERKVDRAVEIWAECLRTGVWPGYERRVAFVEAPSYEQTRWLVREAREEVAA